MTPEDILAELLRCHNPALGDPSGPGEHVAQVWNDGERTSQKGGKLLWQRSLHSFVAGRAYPTLQTVLLAGLPGKYNGFSYIFATSEDADRLSALVNDWQGPLESSPA